MCGAHNRKNPPARCNGWCRPRGSCAAAARNSAVLLPEPLNARTCGLLCGRSMIHSVSSGKPVHVRARETREKVAPTRAGKVAPTRAGAAAGSCCQGDSPEAIRKCTWLSRNLQRTEKSMVRPLAILGGLSSLTDRRRMARVRAGSGSTDRRMARGRAREKNCRSARRAEGAHSRVCVPLAPKHWEGCLARSHGCKQPCENEHGTRSVRTTVNVKKYIQYS